MNRCLSERSLVELYSGDGTWAERAHLRLCADCAERYDVVIDDLKAISDILAQAPSLVPARSRVAMVFVGWLPAAVAAAMLFAVGLAVTRRLTPTPVQMTARPGNVSAFADDVSAALFASNDTSSLQGAFAVPYLEVALEAGLPCTQERFYDGRCDDQVAALVFEGE